MAAGDLTTLAELKVYLRISAATWDTELTALIAAISKFFHTECDVNFLTATYTDELHDGDGEYYLMLLNPFQLTAFTTLKINYLDATSYDEVDSDDYKVYEDSGIIYYAGGFPKGHQNIAVTYTSGYADAAAIPVDLKLGIHEMIRFIFKSIKLNPSVIEETIDVYSYKLSNKTPMLGNSWDDLPFMTQRALMNYCRRF